MHFQITVGTLFNKRAASLAYDTLLTVTGSVSPSSEVFV